MKQLHELTAADFRTSEKVSKPGERYMHAGIRHWIRTKEFGLEDHECYQFDSVLKIIEAIEAMQKVPGMEKLEVVTFYYGYKKMKVLYRWTLPLPEPEKPAFEHYTAGNRLIQINRLGIWHGYISDNYTETFNNKTQALAWLNA